MKKIITFFVVLLSTIMTVFAQSPQNFNYQGVLRNSAGEIISDQEVSVRISIIKNNSSGAVVYMESHSTQTNSYGQFNLTIGSGMDQTGSVSQIAWNSDTYFLRTEIDEAGGTNFIDLGTVQLLSVPYALHANSATKALAIDNPVLYFTDTDTLFAVKDRSGNLVFAVFPDGAVVYVNETVKGKVGGFAVSGRSPSKAIEYDVLRVTPDSSRIYVNKTVGKAKVGGFAVSGRSPSKLGEEEYLVVTSDSTRVYVNQDTVAKGKVGGFAVSGRSPSKSTINNFMDLTPENYFIGQGSGINISEGVFNSTLGYESGLNLITGSSNAFLGYQSGYNTMGGSGNLFLGYQSGFSNLNGDYNTFVGYQSGQSNVDGKNNTFLGSFAGKNNVSGSYNTFIGDSTGYSNTSGNNNTFLGTKVGYNNTEGFANLFIGNFAGFSNEVGFENIFLGDFSGYSNVASGMNVAIGVRSGYLGESGWNNVYLGTETGYSNIDGEGNVFIGYQTGMNNTGGTRNIFIGNRAGMDEQGSGKLIIDNRDLDSTRTFIWGNLDARSLRFNANIGIGANPLSSYDLILNDSLGLANQTIMGVGDSYNYSQFILAADDGADTTEYIVTHDFDHRYRLFYNDGENLFPRLGVDTLGRVMIGSWDDGSDLLHVNGTARFENVGIGTNSNYQNLAVYNGVDPAIVSIMGKGNAYDYASLKLEADIETDTLSYMLIHDIDHRFRIFYYDGTDLFPRIGVDTTGKVMIGGAWEDATEMLDVDGNARFRSIGSGAYQGSLNYTSDGRLTTSTSDIRLKDNINSLENSLPKVMKLRGVNFTWKSDPDLGNRIGFIAQEVEEVFPELVFTNKKDGYKGVNYQEMTAVLLEAIKELKAENDELKKKVNEIINMLEQED